MLTRLIFLALIAWAVFTLVFGLAYASIHAAFAHAPPGSSSEVIAWFARQKVPEGDPSAGMSCCDQSDGHVTEEDEWRIEGGHYEVNLSGTWVQVPDTRVLHLELDPNPTGRPVVWHVGTTIFCFAPGTVS